MSAELAVPRASRRTARGFDRLSGVYDALARACFGPLIPRSQELFLDDMATRGNALIVGGGTGGFLVSLVAAGFRGRIVNLDASASMLRRTRERLRGSGLAAACAIDHVQGGVEALSDGARFDLVCTNYFLDLFENDDLVAVMRKLDGMLAGDGLWLCTDFSPPRGPALRRIPTALLVSTLYAAFALTCGVRTRRLPPIESGFAGLGYVPRRRETVGRGLLWSALYRRGAGAAAIGPNEGPAANPVACGGGMFHHGGRVTEAGNHGR
ncbi:MAG: class I SAM-dependent methyltransferase [bacterium]|nr:class I SAM-dependent methyltransferase [bacterium]